MFNDDDLFDILGGCVLGYILGAIIAGLGFLLYYLCIGIIELFKCIYRNRYSIAARIKAIFAFCKRSVKNLYGFVKGLLVHNREEVQP